MRTVPGVDPRQAMDAIEKHLLEHAPFGDRVEISDRDLGPGYLADVDSPVSHVVKQALTDAWGVQAVNIGVGGSIPFISEFQETFPHAQVVVTGVEDPLTNAHSEDESQSLPDLKNAVLAEALVLSRLAEK